MAAPTHVAISKEWLDALVEWADRLALDAQALAVQGRKILDALEQAQAVAEGKGKE